MAESDAIELEHLHKSYQGTPAVKNVNLTVNKGELFGFLGPNGAGKTTTIKMMTGLLEPSSGTARILGVDIQKEPLKAKQRIAYIPDQPDLYPKLTGWEYLRFIGSVFHMDDAHFEKRAEELLGLFQLQHRVHDLIEAYSHGMKQKIALCGAFLHEPDVIFLDEPTVGLDPKSARHLKNLLREVCDRGAAVFLSTHILEIAERMCDRVGIVKDGEIIALGTMDQLREQGDRGASLEEIFLERTGGEASSE